MAGIRSGHWSAELVELRSRLERWRRSAARGRSIPGPLWESIAEVARGEGVCRVALALGLNYESVKARVARSASASRAPAAFVELRAGAAEPQCGSPCLLELEAADGSRLALRFSGAIPSGAAGLTEAFLGRRQS